MCSYVDQVIERGRIAGYDGGYAEGYAEGIAEARHDIITRMLTISPIDTVVKFGGFSFDEVKLVYDEMLQNGSVQCES